MNPITFSGNPLDRAGEKRGDPAWIAARKADAAARFLPLWQLQVLVRGAGAGWLVAQAVTGLDQGACVFLGLQDGAAHFALELTGETPPQLDGAFREVRAAAFDLHGGDAAIAGQARALIDWHRRHRFCANCGAATDFADGGWRRVCPACAAEHFPRTDPVAIMLPVFKSEDGVDHCLLGRNARFPDGLYSAFAGFVEPGETLEEAVRRELAEEVNLTVQSVRYHASQPWPFPSSLMLGCYAQASSREFRIDGREIVDARWMTRGEVCARLADQIADDMKMPGIIAIAHRLLKDWAWENGAPD